MRILAQPIAPAKPIARVLQDVYFLAQAYMNQGDFLNCAWYGTRADVYAGQFASQIEPLAKYCYHKYHGNTDDQWAALQGAFPTGVCDFTQPGVGFQPNVPWRTYQGGPGGVALGDPPVSHPVN